jgi:Flp pilus assembly protein TadD
VYGIALYDTGKRPEALKTLGAALARHPYDREVLFALATYERAGGNLAGAREHARLLRELEPENPEFGRLATQLGVAR